MKKKKNRINNFGKSSFRPNMFSGFPFILRTANSLRETEAIFLKKKLKTYNLTIKELYDSHSGMSIYLGRTNTFNLHF